jgi:hypothetical protein
MIANLRTIPWTELVVTTSLNLLSNSLAPTAYANHYSSPPFATKNEFMCYMVPRTPSAATRHGGEYKEPTPQHRYHNIIVIAAVRNRGTGDNNPNNIGH